MQSAKIMFHKGRGTGSEIHGRFARQTSCAFDDGWSTEPEDETRGPKTSVTEELAHSIISKNHSPDIPFEQSVNPYRGCEHGCPYCYARPSHAYLDLSPGIDFETRLFAKVNAPEILRNELGKRSYVPSTINFGANTDPYQPIERSYQLTRRCLEVMLEARHPVTIVTKNALVARDIDVLAAMAKLNLVHVFVSITSLDNPLSRVLEPRASTPANRIEAVRQLSAEGIPTSVLVAPIIPFVTDVWIERVLEASRAAGAVSAGYTVIRLPWEVNPIFKEWLETHLPERAAHVMERIRDLRGGRENSSRFGERMKGAGIYAQLTRQRFAVAMKRLGYLRRNSIQLETAHFRAPTGSLSAEAHPQASLF